MALPRPFVGAGHLDRHVLIESRHRRVVAAGERLEIHVLGLATVEDDVTPELARAAIASIRVLGAFIASPALKDALADRIHA